MFVAVLVAAAIAVVALVVLNLFLFWSLSRCHADSESAQCHALVRQMRDTHRRSQQTRSRHASGVPSRVPHERPPERAFTSTSIKFLSRQAAMAGRRGTNSRFTALASSALAGDQPQHLHHCREETDQNLHCRFAEALRPHDHAALRQDLVQRVCWMWVGPRARTSTCADRAERLRVSLRGY